MKRVSLGLLVLAGLMMFAACSATGSTVVYQDPQSVERVSEDFGSTDLHMIAEKMVDSLLQTPILNDRPVLFVSAVKNKTHEHIDTKSITDKIRTTLLRSGKVRFTATSDVPDEIINQLEFQNSNLVDPKTGKRYGKIIGADYILHGEISSIVKTNRRVRDVYYKITLQLANIENGLIEWADEKEIRKTAKNDAIGW